MISSILVAVVFRLPLFHRFTKLMTEMHELGTKMRQLASLHLEHQESLEVEVIEDLEEYSSIIHTLPVLIKMHEEAMASFNDCRQKGSVSCLC